MPVNTFLYALHDCKKNYFKYGNFPNLILVFLQKLIMKNVLLFLKILIKSKLYNVVNLKMGLGNSRI